MSAENIAPDANAQPSRSLTSRTMKAGTWLIAMRMFQQLIALSRPLVLARILAPEDFGIMGIAFMTRIIINRIGLGGGMQDALIRKDDLTREEIAAAWTFEVVRLSIFGAIIAASAPLIADFFNTSAATPILRIAGLQMALRGFTSFGLVFARKELLFRKEFLAHLVPEIIATTVTIWLAFELRNVWALALGQLTQSVLYMVMSYVLAPYFVRPNFRFTLLRGIVGFAVWTSATNLISAITSQADRIFVGRMLGSTGLGLYALAGRITNLASIEVANGVARVGFPAFAKVQKQEAALNKAFSQMVSVSIALLGPLSLYIAVWAPEMVEVVLGSQWLDSIPIVRILAGSAILLALGQMYVTVLRSMGDARTGAVAAVVRLAITGVVAYPLINEFGLSGAAYSLIAGLGGAFVFLLWRSHGTLQVNILHIIRYCAVALPLAGGLLFVPAIRSVDSFGVVYSFILGTVAFSGMYVIGSIIIAKVFHTGPLQMFLDMRSKRVAS